MTERMYRLLEALQRVDRMLDLARSRRLPDPFEIAWLERTRRKAGSRFRDGLVQS